MWGVFALTCKHAEDFLDNNQRGEKKKMNIDDNPEND